MVGPCAGAVPRGTSSPELICCAPAAHEGFTDPQPETDWLTPLARTERLFTVAKTTGTPTATARRRNALRPELPGVGDAPERPSGGRVLSSIRIPTNPFVSTPRPWGARNAGYSADPCIADASSPAGPIPLEQTERHTPSAGFSVSHEALEGPAAVFVQPAELEAEVVALLEAVTAYLRVAQQRDSSEPGRVTAALDELRQACARRGAEPVQPATA